MHRFMPLALCLATTAALAAGSTAWRRIDQPLAQHGVASETRFDAFYRSMVEAYTPQHRAAEVLQLAINGYEGAAEYAIANASTWRGEVEPSATLEAMITTAMRSPRLEVRMAAFEVTLSEYDLARDVAEVDRLIALRRDEPEQYGTWALWGLGLLGARGIDRERVHGELLAATQDTDVGHRVDAVEALAVFGGAEVIAPLLAIAAGDPDGHVQERAFCALAQSATLHVAERHGAVPGLLAIAGDLHASARQRSWSYQALREITGLYDVADDPVSWQRAIGDARLLPTIAR